MNTHACRIAKDIQERVLIFRRRPNLNNIVCRLVGASVQIVDSLKAKEFVNEYSLSFRGFKDSYDPESAMSLRDAYQKAFQSKGVRFQTRLRRVLIIYTDQELYEFASSQNIEQTSGTITLCGLIRTLVILSGTKTFA